MKQNSLYLICNCSNGFVRVKNGKVEKRKSGTASVNTDS